jgi:hypothetical protein
MGVVVNQRFWLSLQGRVWVLWWIKDFDSPSRGEYGCCGESKILTLHYVPTLPRDFCECKNESQDGELGGKFLQEQKRRRVGIFDAGEGENLY